MSNNGVSRKWNFNPDDYTPPTVKYTGSGTTYEDYRGMSNYQAVRTIYAFMNDNQLTDPNFRLTTAHVDEAQRNGQITIPGREKPIALTPQQRAAFVQLGDNGAALFRRLDKAGSEEDVEDQSFGIADLRNAIKKGRIHSAADVSPYHTDPTSKLTAPDTHAGVKDYFAKRYGESWSQISKSDILSLADGSTDANRATELAAGWLMKNWKDVAGDDDFLSKEEFDQLLNKV